MSVYCHPSSCAQLRTLGYFDVREDSLSGDSGPALDTLRSRAAAEHAVNGLNIGSLTVERHRALGCRILPNVRELRS